VSLDYLVKCQKVIVSVGVSRMGKTGIVFVEPGAKVNSEYYCQHVLGGGLTYLRRENVTFIEPDT